MNNKPLRPPLPFVSQFVDVHSPKQVLDLGSGDGRNSIYLAEQGHIVTSVDKSETFLDMMSSHASEQGVESTILIVKETLETYIIQQEYDVVLSNYVLHILDGEWFEHLVHQIKSATRVGGLALVSDFTQTGPMYSPDKTRRWLCDGELKEIFYDWEILHYKESIQEARMKDSEGKPLKQMVAEIVARKLS